MHYLLFVVVCCSCSVTHFGVVSRYCCVRVVVCCLVDVRFVLCVVSTCLLFNSWGLCVLYVGPVLLYHVCCLLVVGCCSLCVAC